MVKFTNISRASFVLSTDEYQILVLVFERGQVPKKSLYSFTETNTSNFNICLTECKQILTRMNKDDKIFLQKNTLFQVFIPEEGNYWGKYFCLPLKLLPFLISTKYTNIRKTYECFGIVFLVKTIICYLDQL